MATKLLFFLIIFSMLNVKGLGQSCDCQINVSKINNEYTKETCDSWKAWVVCNRPCETDEEIMKNRKDGKDLRTACGMPEPGAKGPDPGAKGSNPGSSPKGSSSKSVPPLFTMASVLLGLYLAHRYGKPE
ncbi:hypothetical protein DdX_14716 [Ditylenchus destructor]|uniref:Uncharacterized protein n=1 Tax=Ditylenchus destructor TaxID=166010 RepID=A0AAD4MRQ2_9BILA|nr:hypothetical protein DdX_14716 [Ditylenchus destructor]